MEASNMYDWDRSPFAIQEILSPQGNSTGSSRMQVAIQVHKPATLGRESVQTNGESPVGTGVLNTPNYVSVTPNRIHYEPPDSPLPLLDSLPFGNPVNEVSRGESHSLETSPNSLPEVLQKNLMEDYFKKQKVLRAQQKTPIGRGMDKKRSKSRKPSISKQREGQTHPIAWPTSREKISKQTGLANNKRKRDTEKKSKQNRDKIKQKRPLCTVTSETIEPPESERGNVSIGTVGPINTLPKASEWKERARKKNTLTKRGTKRLEKKKSEISKTKQLNKNFYEKYNIAQDRQTKPSKSGRVTTQLSVKSLKLISKLDRQERIRKVITPHRGKILSLQILQTINAELGKKFKINSEAIEVLSGALENLFTELFTATNLMAIHNRRVTTMPRDVQAATNMLKIPFFNQSYWSYFLDDRHTTNKLHL